MYGATAFIILETADIVLPGLGLPEWTVTLLIILLIIGFPITAIISWIFDITPEGILKTDTAVAENKKESIHQPIKRLINVNNTVILILFAAVCFLIYPRIFNKDTTAVEQVTENKTIDLIAVLPFSNIKSDPETDYLGFAIADQIIGNLVYIQNIIVRPSGSIRKYEKQVLDPISVGQDLNVNYVLLGNYLREGNIIRLNIELVDVHRNEMIWHEPIEIDFVSAFELQDIVAEKVVEGLNVQLSQTEMNRIEKDIPDSPLAYEYYLRSISYPSTNEGDQLAIEMLNKSIELDSTYAPAYAQLADRIHRLALFGLLDPEETGKSESLHLKALTLNEELIFSLANLAQIYTETDRIVKAVELTKQILEINPNNAEAHFSLGYIYRYAGINNEALQEMEEAVRLDPMNPGFRSIVITYQIVGDFTSAIEISKTYDQSSFILSAQGLTFLRMGDKKKSIECLKHSIAIDPEGLSALFATSMKSIIEGNIDEGLEAGRRFEKADILDAEAWYTQASLYGLMDYKEGCVRCLQRAVDGGFFNYPFMLTDTFLDSMRDDAEFLMILQRAKKKHLAFLERFF